MNRTPWSIVLFAAALVELTSCALDHTLLVKYRDDASLATGFACLAEDEVHTVLERRLNAPGADPDHVQIVVDVVQVRRNVTGLWPADLIDECLASDPPDRCPVLAASRRCSSVRLDPELRRQFALLGTTRERERWLVPQLNTWLAQSDLHAYTSDAPDGLVLLRIVGTTESCEAVRARGAEAPPFVRENLVGCSVTPPLELDRFQGDYLRPGLPFAGALGGPCTANAVAGCAGLSPP